MPTEKIRDFLIQNPTFQRKVDDVIILGVLNELPGLSPPLDISEINWSYMLLCASALARSEKSNAQRIALRIADTCIKSLDTTAAEKQAAAVVLDVMANQRAQHLALMLNLIPPQWDANLPLPLRADQTRRSAEDCIKSNHKTIYPVNRFQRDFWEALHQSKRVSASAPTSAGKSFILRLWVAEAYKRNPNASVVAVVPTRALIQEFSDEFAQDIINKVLPDIPIHTLPINDLQERDKASLYVFTQERLHILLDREKQASFDIIIVDEAHKIGDSYRGVLLEQVLEECIKRNTHTQVVYAAPFVDNPEYLLRKDSASENPLVVDREVATVTQNLLFATQSKGSSTDWKITFENDEKSLSIGTLTLPFRPASVSKRVTLIALALGRGNAGNLLYANGAAEAEKYAQQIFDGLGQLDHDCEVKDKRVNDLIKLIKKTIHPKYNLAQTLTRGVAYHYGNMPLLIRTEVESLFRDKIVKYLVCTGTLIEGVNLPCKAIYMRGPTKGKNTSMADADFWNLAGRAGRWGKEFHGTIVCIDAKDPKVWKIPPPKKRVKQNISSTVGQNLRNLGKLDSYVRDGYPEDISEENPEYNYTISFFLHIIARDGHLTSFAQDSNDFLLLYRLQHRLKTELEKFYLPISLIFAHPGILPATMVNLHRKLSLLSDEELLQLSPVQPEGADAADVYLRIIQFIDVELRAKWAIPGTGRDNRLKQLSFLVVDWMRGRPLAVLIRTREKIEEWKRDKGQNAKKLPAIIIQVMRDVEEYARFKIPKYLKAFLDVLSFTAASRNLDHILLKLPDLELWMEFGVSTKTQLILMELGLSRTTTIELMEFIMNDTLDKSAVIKWLKGTNFEGLQLNAHVAAEVGRLLVRLRDR